jgi:hypothetical protein
MGHPTAAGARVEALAQRGEGAGGVSPPTPARGSGGALGAFPMGSGAKPQQLLVFQ